jgi:hypothetical protein
MEELEVELEIAGDERAHEDRLMSMFDAWGTERPFLRWVWSHAYRWGYGNGHNDGESGEGFDEDPGDSLDLHVAALREDRATERRVAEELVQLRFQVQTLEQKLEDAEHSKRMALTALAAERSRR